jgi:hypothetical protein
LSCLLPCISSGKQKACSDTQAFANERAPGFLFRCVLNDRQLQDSLSKGTAGTCQRDIQAQFFMISSGLPAGRTLNKPTTAWGGKECEDIPDFDETPALPKRETTR